ncbi:MAG: hypothetical protein B5M53_09505 [Candidatus Cloacimonas sp. 4484_209]|nr:MAG: hypothetical protein B5M53_09505 [Candidatus Cloacimonas sp. 4484_209]
MSTSFSFSLKSHKHGIKYKLLYEHLKNVGETSKKNILSKKIENSELFAEISCLIGISHDFGKGTTYFQKHLKENKKTEKAYHGKLSSIFGYYLIKKYLESNNILNSSNQFLPFVAWLVILKHHGDIGNLMDRDGELEKLNELETVREQIEDIKRNYFDELKATYKNLSPIEINLGEFFSEFDNICVEIKEKGEELAIAREIKNYFLILFFYSVLLDADKLDASGIDFELLEREKERWNQIPADLVDRYKAIRFTDATDIDIIRNEAYYEVISNLREIKENPGDTRVLSIELPTGCGKTLTAFSFALKMREIVREKIGFTPKIIYSLPFLSIIDQNAGVLSEVLLEPDEICTWEKFLDMSEDERRNKLDSIPSSLLLKHHHLVDVKYKTEDEELDIDAEKSLLLIEGWHSEIMVTTFIQFFHSLITNRNKAARKFHNMINSIIILDEVQSIPYEYWRLVKDCLAHLAYTYNCWIILMTATQPFIFREREIKPLITHKEKYFEKFNRVKYLVKLEAEEFSKFKERILAEILNGDEDIAVIVNTISASKDLHKFLRKELKGIYGEAKIGERGIAEFKHLWLINLSTHVLPVHRAGRIREIKERGDMRKIIITTQLIEAGVDISVDRIYRDFAPFDCIVQSGGRCNRNGEKEEGICEIVYLKDERNRGFCNIYDSTLMDITREILEKKNYVGENELGLFIQKYFEMTLDRGSEEKSKGNLEAMRRLNFSDIGEFKLIKGDRPKIDVFVEIDDDASRIWKDYEEIRSIENRFERKNRFLEIRNEFYNYVISIDAKDAEKVMIEPYLGQ